MTPNLEKAIQIAKDINARLTVSDLQNFVIVDSRAGYFYRLNDALALKWDEYYLIFQEHSPPQVIPDDDALVIEYDYDRKTVEIPVMFVRLPFSREAYLDGIPIGTLELPRAPQVGTVHYIYPPRLTENESKKGAFPVEIVAIHDDQIVLQTPDPAIQE